ncbi:MAG: head maturation protease, ClpP-related [Planctomycetota bacterium]
MSEYSAKVEDHKLTLNLFGPVGSGPMIGDGFTSGWVAQQIDKAGGIDQIDVFINSVGGDVFEGYAIYNLLDMFQGQVNVFVIGTAASIASIIMMAGDQRVMYEGAEVMIHNAASFTFGDASSHEKQAKQLAKLDSKLASTYAKVTGGDSAAIADLMAEETWFEPDEAMQDGFATHLHHQAAKAPPDASLINFFYNVPLKVAAWAGQASGETPTPTVETQVMTEEEKEEPVAEEATEETGAIEEEETMDSLRAQITDLKAQLAEAMGEDEPEEEDEEMPAAQSIAKAFAHDQAFAVSAIGDGLTLAQAQAAYVDHAKKAIAKARADSDGVDPVSTIIRVEDATDDELVAVYRQARVMKTDYGRQAYLNDRGIDPNDYEAWLKNAG